MVECLAALLLLGGVAFAIYFQQRIRRLEKRMDQDLSALKEANAWMMAQLSLPAGARAGARPHSRHLRRPRPKRPRRFWPPRLRKHLVCRNRRLCA